MNIKMLQVEWHGRPELGLMFSRLVDGLRWLRSEELIRAMAYLVWLWEEPDNANQFGSLLNTQSLCAQGGGKKLTLAYHALATSSFVTIRAWARSVKELQENDGLELAEHGIVGIDWFGQVSIDRGNIPVAKKNGNGLGIADGVIFTSYGDRESMDNLLTAICNPNRGEQTYLEASVLLGL